MTHVAAKVEKGCTWCRKEVLFLQVRSAFAREEIEAYAGFYGILDLEPWSLKDVARWLELSLEDAELKMMEIADWLMVNCSLRSLPRRCSVCGHAQGPEDLAHLKEPVAT